MNSFKDWFFLKIQSSSFKRAMIAFIAAVVMHYAPDNIDDIIKLFLVAFGVADLTTQEKK